MVRAKYSRGFSLVEVLISVILVGLAIAALVAASNSFTLANGAGANLSTAEFLVEQIRELTAMLPVVDPDTTTSVLGPEEPNLASYDDVDDFDGASFSPPIAANRVPIDDLSAFRQEVVVENVSASDFEQVVGDRSSSFVRVTAKVYLNSRAISSATWIRAEY